MVEKDSLKQKIKETLANVGRVLAGKDSKQRLTVLRCSTPEQVRTALRLFEKAYPKLKWEPISVHDTGYQQAIAHAVALYEKGTKRIPILHEFSGEETGKPADAEEVSGFGRLASQQRLAEYPVVIVILAPSVGAFVKGASSLWKARGGYFAWPTPPPVFEDEQPEDGAPGVPDDADLQDVLKQLSGNAAAEYLMRIGEHHVGLRDWEKSRLFLIRAVQIFSQNGSLSGMARAYGMLGNLALKRGDLNAALEWMDQAIDNYRVLDDLDALAALLSQKGHALYLKGHLDRATKAFREATELDREQGNEQRLSAGIRPIAMVLERLNKWAAAEKLYRESLQMEEEAGRPEGVARCKVHLGRVIQMKGDLTAAREHYEQGLAIHEELGCKDGLATALHHLGGVLLESKELKEATEAYDRSIELEIELKDFSGLSRTHAERSIAMKKSGKYEDAIRSAVVAHYLASQLRTGMVQTLTERVAELEETVSADDYNRILRDATAEARNILGLSGAAHGSDDENDE